eukprot:Nk52_evm1s1364 gene=Nk52_evmTU1s1364
MPESITNHRTLCSVSDTEDSEMCGKALSFSSDIDDENAPSAADITSEAVDGASETEDNEEGKGDIDSEEIETERDNRAGHGSVAVTYTPLRGNPVTVVSHSPTAEIRVITGETTNGKRRKTRQSEAFGDYDGHIEVIQSNVVAYEKKVKEWLDGGKQKWDLAKLEKDIVKSFDTAVDKVLKEGVKSKQLQKKDKDELKEEVVRIKSDMQIVLIKAMTYADIEIEKWPKTLVKGLQNTYMPPNDRHLKRFKTKILGLMDSGELPCYDEESKNIREISEYKAPQLSQIFAMADRNIWLELTHQGRRLREHSDIFQKFVSVYRRDTEDEHLDKVLAHDVEDCKKLKLHSVLTSYSYTTGDEDRELRDLPFQINEELNPKEAFRKIPPSVLFTMIKNCNKDFDVCFFNHKKSGFNGSGEMELAFNNFSQGKVYMTYMYCMQKSLRILGQKEGQYCVIPAVGVESGTTAQNTRKRRGGGIDTSTPQGSQNEFISAITNMLDPLCKLVCTGKKDDVTLGRKRERQELLQALSACTDVLKGIDRAYFALVDKVERNEELSRAEQY